LGRVCFADLRFWKPDRAFDLPAVGTHRSGQEIRRLKGKSLLNRLLRVFAAEKVSANQIRIGF
jgi:hypothetical protein